MAETGAVLGVGLLGEGTLGGRSTVDVVGSPVCSAPALQSTGMRLKYKATPIRMVAAVLLGATLTVTGGSSTVNLAGRVRVQERLTGRLATKVAPQGQVRVQERLTGRLATKVPLAGIVRSEARLTGRLTTRVALAGSVRSEERLTGLLATKVPLAGRVRVQERLRGALQMAGTTVSLAGTTRLTPERLLSTEIRLKYEASPIRAGIERLRGLLSFAGITTNLAGRVRVHPRLYSPEIVVYRYASEVIGAYPRLLGQLSSKTALRGTVRTAERLRGSLQMAGTVANLAGSIRAQERLTGRLTTRVALAGTVRSEGRLSGLLATKVALQGRVRVQERLTGRLQLQGTTVQIAGVIRSGAVLRGDLSPTGGARPGSSGGRFLHQKPKPPKWLTDYMRKEGLLAPEETAKPAKVVEQAPKAVEKPAKVVEKAPKVAPAPVVKAPPTPGKTVAEVKALIAPPTKVVKAPPQPEPTEEELLEDEQEIERLLISLLMQD